ncbi:MAG: lysophospholipid acyltransferase family protein [Candidatus Electrothrix sp. GW3-4]|uniref:lysophospholipid acyltransferase family protein n=1 Tax=Candidatus Electrothrix sp. GW3-4 TaxID=3126740 RepID=UPI0030D23118
MQTGESPIRDILRLIVWYPLRWFLLAMPPKVALTTLRFMGDLHYRAAQGKRQMLAANLHRMGIAPSQHEENIRLYFRNHYQDQLFPLVFPKFKRKNIADYVNFQGLAHLDKALEKKKGVVLVHGHFGPAHLPLVSLALMGYPMQQIGNPSDKGLSWIGRHVAFRLRMHYESRIPADIIQAGSFLRPIFQALRKNQVIMTTGDGAGTEERFGKQQCFNFLGQPVMLPLGPAILVQKTGATLLPLFILPGDRTLFTVIIEPEITSDLPGEQGVLDCTRQFLARLEDYIRSSPGYMHFLDRFVPGQFIAAKQGEQEK